jgi:hypothetical protein
LEEDRNLDDVHRLHGTQTAVELGGLVACGFVFGIPNCGDDRGELGLLALVKVDLELLGRHVRDALRPGGPKRGANEEEEQSGSGLGREGHWGTS